MHLSPASHLLSSTQWVSSAILLGLTPRSIDGVLVRGRNRLPRATEALTYLKHQRIPFILLTNGGGHHESARARFLTNELDVDIDASMIVQSHTPFADMDDLKDKTVLVCGGDHDACRTVAKQ